MEVKVNQEGNAYRVEVSGRIDTNTAADFQAALTPLMEAQQAEITVDCSGMDYTSSQGLRSFLSLQKRVNATGGSLLLTGMQPQVKEVFDITGFSSIIKIA